MIINYPYKFSNSLTDKVTIADHLNGFDQYLHNPVLSHLDKYCATNNTRITVTYHQILESHVQTLYPNLHFKFDLLMYRDEVWDSMLQYTQHPDLDYKNFVCSFNGSAHVSRKLLVAILQRFGYFNTEYCSKNFEFSVDQLDGHIHDYVSNRDQFYRKFFVTNDSDAFFNTINSFGQVQHSQQNIYNLESKLSKSFVNVVSETMATSYVPYVTEKFLHSVVTRGLWIAYAQPGWHSHVEKYYGFRKYNHLFDYRFDDIANPVHRIIELMSMLAKFSLLSKSDWHDLKLLEQDNIEFNYNHYYSGDFIKQLTHATA